MAASTITTVTTAAVTVIRGRRKEWTISLSRSKRRRPGASACEAIVASVSSLTGSSLPAVQPNARIDNGIEQVDDEIDRHEDGGDQQEVGGHHGDIGILHGLEEQKPHARPLEH